MDQFKFVVLDEEDLEVVSTHLQDAVAKVSDVLWRPEEKRLVLAVNRFDWESAQSAKPEYRRRRTALRFERVLSCKCRDVNPAGKDGVLNLLAVEFLPPAVLLDHHVRDFVDPLVSGEAALTRQAFAPAADGIAFLTLP